MEFSENIECVEITHVLDFLSTVFDKGNSLSAANSAKCAIATIIHIPPYDSFYKHPVNKKYMTGIFNI